MDFSQSSARLRRRVSQAKERSAPHRRGRTSKPFAASKRLPICKVPSPILSSAPRSLGPAYPLSAQTRRSQGPAGRIDFGTAGAPSRSGMSAACTPTRPSSRGCRRDGGACGPLSSCLRRSPERHPFRWLSRFGRRSPPRLDWLAPFPLPHLPGQREAPCLQQAAVAPSVEISPHGRTGREVLRQLRPLAGGRRPGGGARSSPPASRSCKDVRAGSAAAGRAHPTPFPDRHIPCMTQASPPILQASGFSPRRPWLR